MNHKRLLDILKDREIKISYKIRTYNWIIVNVIQFYFMMLLIIALFMITLNIGSMLGRERSALISLFFEQGGALIIIMFVSSLMERFQINSYDLDFSNGYSPILSKIHASIICLMSAKMYNYLSDISMSAEESHVYISQSMMWLIVLAQIWIGFGTFSKSRKHKLSISEKVSAIFLYIKLNKREFFYWLVSIAIGPLSLPIILGYGIKNDGVPILLSGLICLILVGIFLFSFIIFVTAVHQKPLCVAYDIWRTKRKIQSLEKTTCCNGFYQGVKYKIVKDDDNVRVTTYGTRTKIDNQIKLKKKTKEKLKEIGVPRTVSKKYDFEEILSCLQERSGMREKVLHTAFDEARKYSLNC